MKKSALPIAIVGGVVLSGTIGAQYASAATGEDAVKIAETHHEPYVYGSTDCSALTQKVYAQLGISLPRTSAAQAGVGTPVSKSNLQPGDLVFFNTSGSGISHVGIYTGNGQMISAESSGIKETGIFVGPASSYWAPKYVTARRVINSSSASASIQASQQTTASQTTTSQQTQSSSSSQSQLNHHRPLKARNRILSLRQLSKVIRSKRRPALLQRLTKLLILNRLPQRLMCILFKAATHYRQLNKNTMCPLQR
ncbi:C40 family peptidase [Terrilactibacillus sp. S3-3]|nr:C40 family peptidase [Terrilactibacillus sp. S3-3]